MIHSFGELLTHLRVFHKKIHKRLTHALNKQLMGLLDEVAAFSYKFNEEVVTTSIQQCLETVRKFKSFNPDRLHAKEYQFYMQMGWDRKEVGYLYGLSKDQLYSKLRGAGNLSADEKAEKGTMDLQIPKYIREKSPEELTDEDGYVIARIQIIQACVGGSLEASKQLLDRFQRFMQSDLKVKWEQVKIMDNFYLSHFLPAIQKNLRMNDPLPRILAECAEMEKNRLSAGENIARIKEICHKGRIDAKSIFRDTLQQVAPEIREVAERATAIDMRKMAARLPDTEISQPGMDRAVEKAKRRGKWKKPNPVKAEQIFEKAMKKSKGVMDLPPPLESEPTPEEESDETGRVPEAETGINW